MMKRFAAGCDVGFDRMRSVLLSLRGAKLGSKVRIGPHCRVIGAAGLVTGDRVWLEASVWIKMVDPNARVNIGSHAFFARNCHMDVMQSISIGAHSLFGPGCVLVDHNHGKAGNLRIDQQPCIAKPIVVGRDVWCGAGVVILPGVTIGDGAIVGANTVVTRDVEPMSIVAGSPARLIGRRET